MRWDEMMMTILQMIWDQERRRKLVQKQEEKIGYSSVCV
jgi:hypothetical protein